MKEETKNLKTSTICQRFQFIYKTMLLYWLRYRENTESKNPKVVNRKNGRIMLSTKCEEVCDSKK